jgi:hypothetical protein
VQFTVAGASTISGTISANGTAGGSTDRTGGSGGSVYLTTGTISGSGTIRANGGGATNVGAGGGGRIAIILTTGGADFSSFGSATVTAIGGDSVSTLDGAAGTVYKQTAVQSSGTGTLSIINFSSPSTAVGVYTLMPTSVNLNNFSSIVIQSSGNLAVDSDDTMGSAAFSAISGSGRDSAYVTIANATGVTFPSTYSLSGYTLVLGATISTTSDWTITSTGRLSHVANYTAETYKINLTITGNLTVDASGEINVDGLGYVAASGPGRPIGSTGTYDGAAYGGVGGDDQFDSPGATASSTYGSITAPTNIGSGGSTAGSGGGAIQITVSGATTVNGTISANGANGGSTDRTGGSGGSVYLTTGTISGSGTVRANGGTATNVGAGGGGRVAIILTGASADFSSFGSATVAATGGDAPSTLDGAAGTVYKQTDPPPELNHRQREFLGV